MTFGAVLIDLYDTLVWGDWERWRRTLAAGLGVDEPALVRAFDETRPARSVGAFGDHDGDIAALIEALGLQATPALVRHVRDLEERELTRDIHLFDDSLPAVRALRADGVRVALVSNCSYNTRPVVDRLGLEDEFDAVILSFEAGVEKPDAQIYELALGRLGVVDPASGVFVDDRPDYCDGAAAVGLDTRLIVRPREPIEEFTASTNGHLVIRSLEELL